MTSDELRPEEANEGMMSGGQLDEVIEVVAPPLVASGTLSLGGFNRLSDYVNLDAWFIVLRDATVRTPQHPQLSGQLAMLPVSKEHIAVIGQREQGGGRPGSWTGVIPKVRRRLTVVLPSLIVSGLVFLHQEASLDAFLESRDPRFIPMVDMEVLPAEGGAPIARYAFALLQRSMIIAAPPIADETPRPAWPPRPAG